eukprot:scaffold107039_cov61-Phaeocystis_antarctica.AAC.5
MSWFVKAPWGEKKLIPNADPTSSEHRLARAHLSLGLHTAALGARLNFPVAARLFGRGRGSKGGHNVLWWRGQPQGQLGQSHARQEGDGEPDADKVGLLDGPSHVGEHPEASVPIAAIGHVVLLDREDDVVHLGQCAVEPQVSAPWPALEEGVRPAIGDACLL